MITHRGHECRITATRAADAHGARRSVVGAALRGVLFAAVPLALLSAPANATYGPPERVVLRWSGPVPTIPGGTSGFIFAGPTVAVSIPAGQTRRIHGTAVGALGVASSGSQTANVAICRQLQSGGAVSPLTITSYIAYEIDGTRRSFPVNSIADISGGNYNVGYCISNPGAVSISNNDNVVGYIVVTPD